RSDHTLSPPLAAVRGLPAEAARPADDPAAARRARGHPDRRHPRPPHAAVHPGERRPGRLRRPQAAQRLQGARGRGHAGAPLALTVTPASAQDRAQVGALAGAGQGGTGASGEGAFGDQGYTGQDAEGAAAGHDIRLEVVKHAEAKKGFVLLPRRWVVERSFGWSARSRRLARDSERLAATLAGWHWLAFVALMLRRLFWESS